MKTSESVLKKICEFEGCVLHAYKPVAAEKYYTIGYGHSGPDVYSGMTITESQAFDYFRKDIVKYEGYVSALNLNLNQNQFDSLVSFTYNCGAGNLQKLVRNRTFPQIAEAMLLYVKGADGKTLPGLVTRRKWEHDLFLTGISHGQSFVNPYPAPKTVIRQANDDVRWLQTALNIYANANLAVDGIWGKSTQDALLQFQKDNGLVVDGIVGPVTRNKLEGK